MVALGVKHFTSLEMWQREQLYYAMDEWATQHQTAQLQQHSVVRGGDFENEIVPGEEVLFETTTVTGTPNPPTEPLPAEGVAQNGRVDLCLHEPMLKSGLRMCMHCLNYY